MSWKWKQNVYFSEITISGEQVFVCLFAWSRVCEVWGLKALQSFLSLHQTVREEIPINEVHTAHLNWQKIQCKNVYEIQIHAWTPNYSSLAWKTKKLGKRCKMCAVQCAMCTVRTLIAKNFSIRMFTKSEFSGSVRSDLTAPFKLLNTENIEYRKYWIPNFQYYRIPKKFPVPMFNNTKKKTQ